MKPLDYQKLGDSIKTVYLDDGKFQLDKNVPTFERDGKYVGDFFNFTMFELDGDNPPIFYHTFSPYDIISKKSLDQAVIMRGGEILVTTDFTPYMRQRTGVMSAVILREIGRQELGKVLYVGTGNIAQCDLAALKAFFPALRQIAWYNPSSRADEFVRLADELGVEAISSKLQDIGDFDVIICHTNAKEPVLTAEMKNYIKPGAFIAAFSSEDFTEVAGEYFNTSDANVLIDWEQTISEAPELKSAEEKNQAEKQHIITLRQLFSGMTIDTSKKYTIYRSHGTPMQNLAALRLLREQIS